MTSLATRAAWRYRPSVIVQTATVLDALVAADIRAHVGQPNTDDDAMLSALWSAACDWTEAYLGRGLLTQTREATYDGGPCGDVVLLPEPVTAITSVTFYDVAGDATAVTTSTYRLDTGGLPPRLVLKDGQSWPTSVRDESSVVVRYTCGWAVATLPKAIRQALLLLTAHWYEHRQPVVTMGGVTPVPMGVEALLMPYRVRTGAA